MMLDKNNKEDSLKIISDDFDWLIEDITQNKNIIKENLVKSIMEEKFDDTDDLEQKIKDISKVIENLNLLKQEYYSICMDDDKQDEARSEGEYQDLSDWTNTSLECIKLFDKEYKIKSWRNLLITEIEQLYIKKKEFIKQIDKLNEFKGRTRVYFSYDSNLEDNQFYKKLSFGLYVMVNCSANSIVMMCKKLLVVAGYSESELKIKVNMDNVTKNEEKIAVIESDKMIKLPGKYSSISIKKDLLKAIVTSFVNRKSEYGTDYIESRKVEEKFSNLISNTTKYTVPYHVIINIIKYLKDFRLLNNYADTKKGKYEVVSDESLKTWIDKNI